MQIERIFGKRYLLVADSDDGAKIERLNSIEEEVGSAKTNGNPEENAGKLYVLDAREIENTLPPKVIISVVEGYEKRELPSEVREKIQYEEYENSPLGTFIEELFSENFERQRRGSYASDS